MLVICPFARCRDWPAGWNLFERIPFARAVGTTEDGGENQGRGGNAIHSHLPECWPVLLGNRLSPSEGECGVSKGQLPGARVH